MRITTSLIFSLCLISNLLSARQNAEIIPVKLACELLIEPHGIDVPNPGLSFSIRALRPGLRNIKQTAYQVEVSGTANFDKGAILWDSHRVASDRMAYIAYAGRPLRSAQKCWWRVRVWDQGGRVSAWSRTASWTMGLLSPADWHARWITAAGAEKYALEPLGYKSADAASADQAKWVQVDLGKPSNFNEVVLWPTFFADRGGYAFPVQFKIETANEPGFASPVLIADHTRANVRNPQYGAFHIPVTNGSGRYVRLTVTRLARANTGFCMSIRQMEVISSGRNIAAAKPVTALDSDESDGFSKDRLTDRAEDYRTFPNYSSMLLRKEFLVKPKLVRALVCATGLSQYELTINGKKIGNYLLSPGWTNYRKTVLYDTYDVTRQLKQGSNAIGIMLGNSVYNIQPDTVRYVKFITTFGPAKAIAQLRLEYADGSVQFIGTGKSWKVAPGPITYSNLYGGEDHDANLEPSGWDRPGFKPLKAWYPAIETGGPGGTLKGLSCAAPPITAIDSIGPVKITRIKDDLYIYDFGQNASMMPMLKGSGPKGSYIRMIPTELLGSNGLADRASATQNGVRPAWWQYTFSGKGSESWSPRFFYQGARYLQVELYPAVAGGALPHVAGLTDVIVHSSSAPVSAFETSNQLFNNIYSLVRWAQRSNMMSFMTDCPQREKMGWLEENQLNGPALRYNFDMAVLCRKLMNDISDSQLDNGFVPNIAPEYFIAGPSALSNGFRNSPEWGSSFIIVPWQQYLFSGDISLLQRYYGRMKNYLAFLTSEAKGNIIYTGLGDWYDIGPKEPWGSQLTPVEYTATAIYYYDASIMQTIAAALGKQDDAAAFRKLAEDIKAAFNDRFYQPATGMYATGSHTTSAMPLYFGLVAPTGRQKLADALAADIRNRGNSFTSGEVGYRFLLRALSDAGYSDVVYNMNNQVEKPGYGYQLKKGATSLTEKWDAGVGSFGSQNHFMSGQINEWFFNDLAGIAPDEAGPGFRKFIIKPAMLKELSWVKGSYTSVSGDIRSEWRRDGSMLRLHITVPVNTSAVVYLPAADQGLITESGNKITGSAGVKFLEQENGFLLYEAGSGEYDFEVRP